MPSPDYLQSYDLDTVNYQRLTQVVPSSFDEQDLDDQGPVDWKHIVSAVAVAVVLQTQIAVVVTGM